MAHDSDKHHRHSIRLQGYDYTAPGAYFVTICVQNRDCLFGDVLEGALRLNDAGRMVQACWQQLPCRFPTIALDTFIVMPNHVHAVVILVGAPLVGARNTSIGSANVQGTWAGTRPAPTTTTLGNIIGAFKSITTNTYIRGAYDYGWPAFNRRLWQRNYWERIIRNDIELDRFREYIQTNPIRWEEDQLYPSASPNAFNQE